MRRAILAGCLAALLYPASPRAEEADSYGDDLGQVEPEGTEVEFAPPPSAPPSSQGGVDQVAETYTVQPGDTLWDLSQRFLGNPWYWPKVWSYNPEIENPHWIYPGNVVRFYPAAEELPAQLAEGQDLGDALPPPPEELADLSVGSLTAPDLMGQDEDLVAVSGPYKIGFVPPKTTMIRQDGFVTQRELEDAGVIVRAFAEKDMLSTYDKVYVSFRNSAQARVGEKYAIYRTVDEIQHPHTGRKFGFLTHIVGSLRVVAIDRHVATAIIESTYDDISRGNYVGPWGSLEKQIITKPSARDVTGVIISSLVPRMPYMGESHVVFIDKGKRDGVEEGNIFKVIRQGDPLSSDRREAARFPKEEVATIVVIDVTNEASAGLVLKAIRELEVGDRVETRVGATQVSQFP